jgi:L-serine deaminase
VVRVVVGIMVGVMVGASRVPLSSHRAVSGAIRRRARRIEHPLVEQHFDVARGARDR